jgi:hypothetical protein
MSRPSASWVIAWLQLADEGHFKFLSFEDSMENLKLVAINELAFNPIPIRDAVENTFFQTPKRQRPWNVQQTQSSGGEMSWQIEVEAQDDSKNLHPLADGNLPTALAWLEQNKDLLTAKV